MVDKIVENWDKEVPKLVLEAAEFKCDKFNLAKASIQKIKASMEQTLKGEREVMKKLKHELIDAEEIEVQTKDSLVAACFDAVFLAIFMPAMKFYVDKSSAIRIGQIQKNKELRQQEKEKEKWTRQMNLVLKEMRETKHQIQRQVHETNIAAEKVSSMGVIPDKSVDLPSVSNHHYLNLFLFFFQRF